MYKRQIYWCEQKKEAKHTCSNAPGSVLALKLFKATKDSIYYTQGKELYEWTKAHLQDSTDYLYFDNIRLDGKIGRAKYAYNSGQMMQDVYKRQVVEYAISEHVEFAGVHSGDATLVFPAQKIYFATARRIKKISRQIAKELNISGPFNIQFLARNNEVKVIECNLRASRSFPFVSKVLKRNFIETATRIMLDAPYSRPDKTAFDIDWIGVKASQFSFSRLHKADPVLGVDMSSTGEVGCIGDDFSEALLNAMSSTGFKIPCLLYTSSHLPVHRVGSGLSAHSGSDNPADNARNVPDDRMHQDR